jgi:hypothetical protein
VPGGKKKLNKYELVKFTDIIKSRILGWAVHVTRMGRRKLKMVRKSEEITWRPRR